VPQTCSPYRVQTRTLNKSSCSPPTSQLQSHSGGLLLGRPSRQALLQFAFQQWAGSHAYGRAAHHTTGECHWHSKPPPPLPFLAPQLLLAHQRAKWLLVVLSAKGKLRKERKRKERKGKERKGKGREGKGREGKERKGKEKSRTEKTTPFNDTLMISQVLYQAVQAKASSPVCGVAVHHTAGECLWHSTPPLPPPPPPLSYSPKSKVAPC